jgi:ATP-dependent exoDNAse (exonuclease V) alpha subunit
MVGDIDQLPSVGPGMVLRHVAVKNNRTENRFSGLLARLLVTS